MSELQSLLDNLNDQIMTEAAKRDRAIDRVREDSWENRKATTLWLEIKKQEALYTLATYDMMMERESIIRAMADAREFKQPIVFVQEKQP